MNVLAAWAALVFGVGPATATAVAERGIPGGDWRIVRHYHTAVDAGWPPESWPWLACVIARETGGTGEPLPNWNDPNGGSYGIMQLNRSNYPWLIRTGQLPADVDTVDEVVHLMGSVWWGFRAGWLLYVEESQSPWKHGYGWAPEHRCNSLHPDTGWSVASS